MYTVLWTDKNGDRWDRLETKEEVIDLLKEIEADENASPLGDVWVYSPKADEYAETGESYIW